MNSIFIFRRDFRIEDNIGYYECLKNSDNIYPIFIFSINQISNKNQYNSNNSVQFMIQSIKELYNKKIINFYYGDEIEILTEIIKNNLIHCIYSNKDYTPYAKLRDENLNKFGQNNNIKINLFDDNLLLPVGSIKTITNSIYLKFTPYYNKFIQEAKISKPLKNINKQHQILKNNKYTIKYEEIDKFYIFNNQITLNGGRTNGLKKIKNTFRNSNKLFTNSASELSPYIKYGCVSIREVYYHYKKINTIESNNSIRQLIWREFYYNIGYYYNVFNQAFRIKYNNIKN